MTIHPEAFEKNLRRILKEKGYKQKDLAKKAGLDEWAVYRWCNKKILPRVDSLVILADALEVSVDSLLEGMIEK